MLCGEEKSTRDVIEEILKDKHYYDTSSGGVTFSGGECLLHLNFMREITGLCKKANISVVVESALNIPWQNIEPLLPYIDSFFVDIKHMDSSVHKRYTGCENNRILENIKQLAQKHPSIIIRVPLIPFVNNSLENLVKTAQFSKSCGNGIKGVELLTYNTLGESKYLLLQEKYTSYSNEPQTNSIMDDLCKHINKDVNEEAYVYYIK
jgi:pyruvate formate lyase activating enzyme